MIITGIGQCSLDYLALVDAYPQVDTKEEVGRVSAVLPIDWGYLDLGGKDVGRIACGSVGG